MNPRAQAAVDIAVGGNGPENEGGDDSDGAWGDVD